MVNRFIKLLSMFLAVVLLVNMLPLGIMAQDLQNSLSAKPTVTETVAEADTADAEIVAEIPEKRTQYSKEFQLSNGLRMATVYAEPVHYKTAEGWKEIDNTLVAKADGTYTNADAPWSVFFPKELTSENKVTVNVDGYSLSFIMDGQIRKSSALQRAVVPSLQSASGSKATVKQPGALLKEMGLQDDKTTPQKLYSRITYADVFENTDVVYDLESNAVKESIVLEQYDASLEGYRYTLYTGSLMPVMDDTGHIDLYAPGSTEPVMSLPSPYMLDNAGQYCDQVQVTLTGGDGVYTMTYSLPQQWLASSERSWPVILDPIVKANAKTQNIQDRTICEKKTISVNKSMFYAGYADDRGKIRGFLQYNELPALTSSDVVVKAALSMYKVVSSSSSAPIEIHKVLGEWNSVDITWNTQPSFSSTVIDYADVGSQGWYSWDITDLVNDWYTEANNGLMIKMADSVENGTTDRFRQFYSSEAGSSYRPKLEIVFRNNNGLEDYWDYTSASAGRAGSGYVNNFTGNLTWVRGDMGFDGCVLPVSIQHIYNLNDSTAPSDDNNANDTGGNYFGMGNGWRTNYSQRLYDWALADTTSDDGYYIWEDADGTDIYFEKVSTNEYVHEDIPTITLTDNGSGTEKYKITDANGNITCFDTNGRLSKLQNNQATPSSITITYTTADGQLIDTITDSAGRRYCFTYTNGLLTRIGYYGTGSTELTYVAYTYDANQNLTEIADKDGETCTYSYTGNVLTGAEDIDGYSLSYTYNTPDAWQPYRVLSVTEQDGSKQGGSLSMAYSRNQTVFTDHNGTVQIYQFDDFGHTVCIQDNEGHAQFTKYPFSNDEERDSNGNDNLHTHQLTLSSKMQNTVSNLFPDSSFENGTTWSSPDTGTEFIHNTSGGMHGGACMAIESPECAKASYTTAEVGKTYTFSAYVKPTNASIKLGIQAGGEMYYSQTVAPGTDWTRIEVSCQVVAGTQVDAYIITANDGDTYGHALVDCVQLEEAPTASRYNLILNGDFRDGMNNWTGTHYTNTTSTVTFGDSSQAEYAAAPQLDAAVAAVTGDYQTKKELTQSVSVRGNAGDTLILAGWARGDSVAMGQAFHVQQRQFRLTGVFDYIDGTKSDPFPVEFNPDAGSAIRWQYSAAPMVAEKDYEYVTVSICYDYNMNTAYFDGIQLYKEEFGASYTYDEDGNLISVVDLEKQTTNYQYAGSDLTQVIQGDKVKMSYEYDDYHNVTKATTEEGQVYNFTYDTYGNNTKVSITANGLTMESSAAYSDGGNRLVSTTDALGETTSYNYDPDTNVLLSVQYPDDPDWAATNYTYDSMYRLARTTMAVGTGEGQELSAAYTYADDRLTAITTPTSTYNFTYGDFGNRTSVKVGTQELAGYDYTDDRNNYLSAIRYGNGDKVEYSYDAKGRLVAQTYEDGDTVAYQYDNSGALATVTDSATGITTKYYYDFTDRLLAYEETGNGHNFKVGYTYDTQNNLTELEQTVNGTTHTAAYTYDDDNRITSMTADGVTVVYTYDDFGRVTQQVTKRDDTTILTESFTYTTKDGKTSAQIASYSTVTAAGSTTYTYTYDGKGNILSISDGTYTTSYVYDSANQLLRENNQAGGFTHTWEYDTAGNILNRKEYAYTTGTLGNPTDTVIYTYGNSNWGDLLTAYDGTAITYDAIGNPNAIHGWSFTWEHGRELAAMSNGTTTWNYTYNADGMRTQRTNGTTTYRYIYNGSTLTQMTVGTDTLYFNYDASGVPLTVTYNGTTYYYATNTQGDIVAILNAAGQLVVSYSYDAWGNLLSTTGTMAATLGTVNPLRYRGYVYDTETGLYYLQSRYYNPELGRFINADGQISGVGGEVLGYNMFAYCMNNPVNMSDSEGNWPRWATIALGAVAAVAAVVVTAATLGAAAPAATCTLTMVGMSIGASYTVAHAAATVAVAVTAVAATAYAGDIAYSSVTGDSLLLDTVFHGNTDAYNTGLAITSVATAGMLEMAAQSPGVCFVAGTSVLAACGYIAIEEVKVGDMVWAENPETGEKELKEVVQTFVNETEHLVHVFVNDEEVITTPEHPFYSPVKGWTAACKLRVGDILVSVNGEYVVIEKIQHEILEAPITVYNFEVADFHTYYVGQCSALVHNECGPLKTNVESKSVANKLGYTKVNNATSRGQAVYYNPKAPSGKRYITADIDSHNGGVWKAASSISNLFSKTTRTGTFNWDLSIRIGD